MTEFSAEQIKDVQLLNVLHTVQSLIESLRNGVRHIGDDIVKQDKGEQSEEASKVLDHWLTICSDAMQTANKALQIAEVGFNLVKGDKDELPKEIQAELRDTVSKTEPIQELISIMKETPEEALERLLMEMMGGVISPADLNGLVNGN